MPTLDMVFTDVGRAAIIAASGVDPVTITEVAVGDSGYTPTAGQTALVNELYRLTTIAGVVAVDDYTMSFSVTDESANAYSLREFGLYSDAGDLIAVYAQTGVILEKSASSFMSLSADVVLETIDAASVTFGDTNFYFPSATTSQIGIVELATDAEAQAGTDGTRALTPASGKALVTQDLAAEMPAGVILPWPLATPPSGWLECNGAAFSTITYPDLAIAYPGGTLPDLRGEFLRGFDNGRGVDSGRTILSAQGAAFAAHNHSVYTHAGYEGGATQGSGAGDAITTVNPGVTSTTGGSETRPRNVAVMYIVRAR